MRDKTSPIRPTDDPARATARQLLASATSGALAVLNPDSGWPHVTRVAVGLHQGDPVTLISDLSLHTRALRADPRACLLIGEPGPKGDPLTHPRLSLTVTAAFVPRPSDDHATIRETWLSTHPKTTLYVDFADFHFVRLTVESAALNAGFGRAYILTPSDLSVGLRVAGG